MAEPVDSSRPDEGILVAYLDGALEAEERAALEARLASDPSLRARLEELRGGGRPFAAAYDALLDAAPTERLGVMLADATSGHAVRAGAGRRLAAIAAAIVLFLVGAAVGYLWPIYMDDDTVEVAESPAPPNWRQVVAEYQTLMTRDTLAIIPESPAVLSDEVTAIGERVGLELTPDRLELPHVYLKMAQLLEFRGMPLARLAYLSREDGPIAFCIIANGQPDAEFAFEQREGSNIVFWTRDGLGYMLIGHAPREALETLAGELASRFG